MTTTHRIVGALPDPPRGRRSAAAPAEVIIPAQERTLDIPAQAAVIAMSVTSAMPTMLADWTPEQRALITAVADKLATWVGIANGYAEGTIHD